MTKLLEYVLYLSFEPARICRIYTLQKKGSSAPQIVRCSQSLLYSKLCCHYSK